MEVCAKRLCDVFPEDRAYGAPARAADNFSHKIALRHGVIAGRGARLPERGLRRKQADGELPVIEHFLWRRLGPAGHAGGVAHQMRDLHLVFPVRGKFRPVLGDRCIKVDQALVGQVERRQGGHRLRCRIDVDDRVLFPRAGLFRVCIAAPEVDDGLAILGDAEGCADIGAVLQVLLKLLAHTCEFLVDFPVRHSLSHGVCPPRLLLSLAKLGGHARTGNEEGGWLLDWRDGISRYPHLA